MGFWAKAKGVFGKVGRGIKSGWNWLTQHKEAISDVAQRATDTFAPQYSGNVRDAIRRGNDLIGKGEAISRYLN